MIGLDTAKSVFQIHGVNETGKKLEIKRKLRRSELKLVLRETGKLHGGDGGLWRGASLARAYSPASVTR